MAFPSVGAICRERLYIETACLDYYSEYQGGPGKGYPGKQVIMEFYPGSEYGENETNWWSPTLHCLGRMLRAAGFDRAYTWPLTKEPTEAILARGFAVGEKDEKEDK